MTPRRTPLSGNFNKPSPAEVSAFIASVMQGDVAAVEKTLQAHPDAHKWQDRAGNSALMMAVINGPSPVIDLLIEKGADVNAQNRHGGNALARAAHFGHMELVKKLLSLGADPSMTDAANQDAATWAKMNGHDDIAAVITAAQKQSPQPPHIKP